MAEENSVTSTDLEQQIVEGEDGGMSIGDGISSVFGFIDDVLGPGLTDTLAAYWANKQNQEAILEFNRIAEGITDKFNAKKQEWVELGRGALPDGERQGQYILKPAQAVRLPDGSFGIDANNDGNVNSEHGSFATPEQAQAYINDDLQGGTEDFQALQGEGVYTKDADDVYINHLSQMRRVVQNIQSPEDRRKFVDSVKKFSDSLAQRSSDYLMAAMSDEDATIGEGDDERQIQSIGKARTALVENLNMALGDTAEAINLADALGTGEINKADFSRAIDVGDALKDTAGDISDQEYFRALAVVGANEEKYDLLRAAGRAAQLDIANKLEAERYKGGFEGMSTRHTRDLAREFLANNTSLAKDLADINIENANIMGDAHVRRAKMEGEASVKAIELKGDAGVKRAERNRTMEMTSAEREGKAETIAADNRIANMDTINKLKESALFKGYRQEEYELARPKLQDEAMSSGVLETEKMLSPYRVGEANYGTPDVAKQMMPKQFDWLSELFQRLRDPNATSDQKAGWLKKLGDIVKGGVAALPFIGDDEDPKSMSNETIMNPELPAGTILDDDGNKVDDRVDLTGDGVIDGDDTMTYNPDTGDYVTTDEDGNVTGSYGQDGIPEPAVPSADLDGDGYISPNELDRAGAGGAGVTSLNTDPIGDPVTTDPLGAGDPATDGQLDMVNNNQSLANPGAVAGLVGVPGSGNNNPDPSAAPPVDTGSPGGPVVPLDQFEDPLIDTDGDGIPDTPRSQVDPALLAQLEGGDATIPVGAGDPNADYTYDDQLGMDIMNQFGFDDFDNTSLDFGTSQQNTQNILNQGNEFSNTWEGTGGAGTATGMNNGAGTDWGLPDFQPVDDWTLGGSYDASNQFTFDEPFSWEME